MLMVMDNSRFFGQAVAGIVVCVGVPPESVREHAQMVPLKVWAVLVLVPRSSISRVSLRRGRDGEGMLGLLRRVQAVIVRLTRIGVVREEWKLI